MIKTPVTYDSVNQRVIDSEGNEVFTTEEICIHGAKWIVASINSQNPPIVPALLYGSFCYFVGIFTAYLIYLIHQ